MPTWLIIIVVLALIAGVVFFVVKRDKKGEEKKATMPKTGPSFGTGPGSIPTRTTGGNINVPPPSTVGVPPRGTSSPGGAPTAPGTPVDTKSGKVTKKPADFALADPSSSFLVELTDVKRTDGTPAGGAPIRLVDPAYRGIVPGTLGSPGFPNDIYPWNEGHAPRDHVGILIVSEPGYAPYGPNGAVLAPDGSYRFRIKLPVTVGRNVDVVFHFDADPDDLLPDREGGLLTAGTAARVAVYFRPPSFFEESGSTPAPGDASHAEGLPSVTPPPPFDERKPLESVTPWRPLPIGELAAWRGMVGLGNRDMQLHLKNVAEKAIKDYAAGLGLEVEFGGAAEFEGEGYRILHPVTRIHLRDDALNR